MDVTHAVRADAKDPSAWHFKGLLEHTLPRAVFTGLQSVWGSLLRTIGRV